MARLQPLLIAAIVLFVVLGLGASTGITPSLSAPLPLVVVLYLGLAVVGFACGVFTVRRSREIDLVRWETVQDGGITSGERQLAHREADQQKRTAGATFFLAAVAPGGWLSYQFRDPEQFGATDLLILAPAFGFAVGLFAAHRAYPPAHPEA